MKNTADTISLLEEVCAGARMGSDSLDDMRKKVSDQKLDEILKEFRDKHITIADEAQDMLSKFGEADKEPPMMAQMMSTLKTNVKLMADDSDATVADLVTDGCNMGIKTLSKRVNECALADRHAHDTARKLIDLETDLLKQVRCYL